MIELNKNNSLGEALRSATISHKNNIALIEVDRDRENVRLTFAELKHQAERFGALLQENGLKPGDRVAILMTNQSKWIISATAVFWSGLTLIPLDYKLTPPEQLALLAHAKPKVLVTEFPIWKRLGKLTQPLMVILTEAPEGEKLNPEIRWEKPTNHSFKYVDQTREDVACIVYSSGTGGRPKGCMLTHGNYLSQAEELAKLYPMQEDDRYFSILPTNHAIDFMCGFFLPLQFGGAVVHQRTLRPEFLASTIKTYGITHMAIVPMILKSLEQKIRENLEAQPPPKKIIAKLFPFLVRRKVLKQFGGKLRFFFAGGAFVDPQSAQFFYDLGIPVVIGYGLTEACTVLTVNDLKPFRNDTVGKPISSIKLQIHQPNEIGVGEVWVKGPTIMKEYLDDPELTQDSFSGEWLKTGDLGQIDPFGHLKLVGRAKNMIVTEGGKNVYPEDIETAFDNLSESHEQCVFAANYVWQESGFNDKLMLVIRPKNKERLEQLLIELKERNRTLSDFKRIGGVVVWDKEFPRTASLKIKRHQLAEELHGSLERKSALKELT